jgi:hypothetical protein
VSDGGVDDVVVVPLTPEEMEGPARNRPMARGTIREIRRLAFEIGQRYEDGDYPAVLSSLAGLEESHRLLTGHVVECWEWESSPGPGDAPSDPETESADSRPGLYL